MKRIHETEDDTVSRPESLTIFNPRSGRDVQTAKLGPDHLCQVPHVTQSRRVQV